MARRETRVPTFPPDQGALSSYNSIKLADPKSHNGSLNKITITDAGQPIHHIIPNYWYNRDDNGIRIWRWLDAQHDFEKGLKKVANTVLRTHFGIGTRNADDEFLKYIDDPVTGRFVNNKTTSTKDVLHETVDFEDLIPGLYDNKPLTVSFPDRTGTTVGFTHILPTILPEINLADILAGENLLDKYPASDLLVDIIVENKHDLDDATKLAKLRTYLGITQRDYSKDAANINTGVFVNLFGKNDLSFFKEILDPASEQSDIVNANVRITILFCYINGDRPIYITLKKQQGDTKKHKRTWYYRFHEEPITIDEKYHEWDFGETKSGAHPCPSIESTVHYITKNIDGRRATAGLQAISNFVSRQFNKVTAKSDKTKLSKGQLQNAEHYKFDAFNAFYEQFLRDFQIDIGLSDAEFTNDIQKIALISFKTIGDQMYLYDAALLATMPDPQAGGAILKGGVGDLDGIPTVVTGDTFLRDYIIYTKSADLICPTTVDKTPGKRKLKVYLKPRNTNPEQLAAAAAAKAAAEEERAAAKAEELKNTIDRLSEFQTTLLANENYVNRTTIMDAEFTKIIESIANFNKIELGGNRIFRTLSIGGVTIKNDNVIACYYNILEKLLLRDEYNILMTELDVVNGVLNAEGLTQEPRINYLRTMNQYISRVNDILASTLELAVNVYADFSPQYYDFNERLNFIKSAYPRGASRKYLPYNVIKHYASNDVLIKRVFEMITPGMRGGRPPYVIPDNKQKRLTKFVGQSKVIRRSNIEQHRYDSYVNEHLDYIATSFNAIEELVSLDGVVIDMDGYNKWFEGMLEKYMDNDSLIEPTGDVVNDKILSLLDDIRYYLHQLGIRNLLSDDPVYTLIDRYAEEVIDSKDMVMVVGDDDEESASESNGKLHMIGPDDKLPGSKFGPYGKTTAMIEGDSDDEGPLPYVPGSAHDDKRQVHVIEGTEYMPPAKGFGMDLSNIKENPSVFTVPGYKSFAPSIRQPPLVPMVEAGGNFIRKTKNTKHMRKTKKQTRKLKPKQTIKMRHTTKNKTMQNLKKNPRTMKKH